MTQKIMGHVLQKKVTLGKKKGSHLEIWVTVGKIFHISKMSHT